MLRLACIVHPGVPNHVTQRGNGRQQTFFSNEDYAAYRDLLAEHCAANGVAVWSCHYGASALNFRRAMPRAS